MRAFATLLIVLLAIATAAGAATRRPSPVDAAGLRGPVSGDASTAAPTSPDTAAAKLRKTAAASPPLASPLPVDDGQCRQECAHTYYRCLSSDYAERCPQAWTLCLADCGRAASGLR
jgi:hypothetical protein